MINILLLIPGRPGVRSFRRRWQCNWMPVDESHEAAKRVSELRYRAQPARVWTNGSKLLDNSPSGKTLVLKHAGPRSPPVSMAARNRQADAAFTAPPRSSAAPCPVRRATRRTLSVRRPWMTGTLCRPRRAGWRARNETGEGRRAGSGRGFRFRGQRLPLPLSLTAVNRSDQYR